LLENCWKKKKPDSYRETLSGFLPSLNHSIEAETEIDTARALLNLDDVLAKEVAKVANKRRAKVAK